MRGRLLDLDEPANGSLGPGEAGGVEIAARPGEDGGDESTGVSDGDEEGEGV